MRMQLCALFSQLHQHKDALHQALTAVKLTHLLLKDMYSLADFYCNKKKVKDSVDGNSF